MKSRYENVPDETKRLWKNPLNALYPKKGRPTARIYEGMETIYDLSSPNTRSISITESKEKNAIAIGKIHVSENRKIGIPQAAKIAPVITLVFIIPFRPEKTRDSKKYRMAD